LVDAAVKDQVLNQPTDWIIRERSHHGRVQTETALEPSRDVVLASAFPDAEVSSCVNAPFARIQTQHYLTETDLVPLAFGFWSYLKQLFF
jgi:hypothetical protein